MLRSTSTCLPLGVWVTSRILLEAVAAVAAVVAVVTPAAGTSSPPTPTPTQFIIVCVIFGVIFDVFREF